MKTKLNGLDVSMLMAAFVLTFMLTIHFLLR